MVTKMRSLWLFFLVGLTTGFIGEKLFVMSQLTTTDDLYIEDQASGDFPVDDEDGEDQSGSGSGDYDYSNYLNGSEVLRLLNLSKEMLPFQPQPSSASPSTTVSHSQDAAKGSDDEISNPTSNFVISTSSPSEERLVETTTADFIMDTTLSNYVEEDTSVDMMKKDRKVLVKDVNNEVYASGGRDSRFHGVGTHEEVTSESMWERTEVLAAVTACGVVGFLCAVFLLLLLAYRMKKKDEGSYDLGDNKLSATAYHKAPTKEFYA
ncbi:syndecan-2-like [Melanotaenia boesemani]|uniref:syndecan-2-like n=1 Tax=Melanotaenia boesemani TaxID=1250792 RepID=UPI001C05C61F|nr:syndecan-2-like [Melanotaenia boesemani]